ncbi:hypothetical protein, partial [Methylophaga sp. UBA5088]|uniref:hypothetical protein n=1 Tax=Methylophaga sp. UBA5088 TaxID=1946898 RepID=UPI00259CCCF1
MNFIAAYLESIKNTFIRRFFSIKQAIKDRLPSISYLLSSIILTIALKVNISFFDDSIISDT